MRDLTLESPTDAKPGGFGTLLGVFTPSLLTILGVIMYQRLGWVVGHAGLAGTLLVILLAHVISVTTGMSVASIATNHTVRTGGNYYIISRSLGLSVGGAIGLALYVALALGVSLYLIGFAEALLVAVDLPWLTDSPNDIRLIGSAALALLALITLTSTSLALRSQLFVLAAILISLVAIVMGTPLTAEGGRVTLGIETSPDGVTLAAVFAVFFPAVTGFTAGVGMSGDLRDPKRSIPLGTLAAIGVGLFIYVSLALLLAFWVPADVLRADYNVLRRVAVRPELVSLGVFAATLSSALGSLLGAPRTLQALAFDGILPGWVAWGNKEPRMALGITLLIAEAGILIARLDVVGAVITMFFLTCYGFLCLACGLETWASPDFRPHFKVPIWVSLTGAVACFLVMFQIDPLAMLAAVVVMAGLYAGLKRRQLVLGAGDTWGGVWSAVVRMGLMRLQQSSSRSAQRNWRPTMVVVGRQRPQNPLLDFGTELVGDRGILTHIHLKEGEPPNPLPDRVLEKAYPGIFARVQGCRDVYEAIPEVAAHFGLVGMETNSILLGWPQLASQRTRYAEMIDRLVALDLSVLMLRYDEKRKFGTREQLDIWWDGEASTGPLMLTLAHMLTTHPDWKDTEVRVLVNGRRGQDEDRAQRALDSIIQESRVRARGILLPPVEGEAGLAARIRQESSRADLVMIHARRPREGLGFVATNDDLMRPLGTTLLVRPSTFFEQKATVFETGTTDLSGFMEERLSVPAPVPALGEPLEQFQQRLSDAVERFSRNFDRPTQEEEMGLVSDFVRSVEDIRQLERRLERRGSRRAAARGLLEWAQSRFLSAVEERTRGPFRPPGQLREPKEGWERRWQQTQQRFVEDVQVALARLPVFVEVHTDWEDWLLRAGDGAWTRARKGWIRWWRRRPPPRRVAVRYPAETHFQGRLGPDVAATLKALGVRRLQALHRSRKMVQATQRLFGRLQAEIDQAPDEEVDVEALSDVVSRQLLALVRQAQDHLQEQKAMAERGRTVLSERLETSAASFVRCLSESTRGPPAPPRREGAEGASWAERHRALLDALRLDLQLDGCVAEGRRGLAALEARIRREVQQGPLGAIDQAIQVMERVAELREQYEQGLPSMEAPVLSSAEAGEAVPERVEEGSPREVREPSGTVSAWNEVFVEAADQLRTVFDRTYRPDVSEMMEQLLGSLARGADRVSSSVTVLTDAGLEDSLQGRLGRASLTVPARRLVQVQLETKVGQWVQRKLRTLPEEVTQAEQVLVDAVRLVAFELEQAAAAEREDGVADVEEAGTLALGGTLEERIRRLREARHRLYEYVEQISALLTQETVQRVEEIRNTVSGSAAVGSVASTSRGRWVDRWTQTAHGTLRSTRARTSQWVSRLRPSAPAGRETPSTVVDQLLRLREELTPNADVQANLPLLYRRIFGRSPLENRDLMVGRDAQLERLGRLAERWSSGHPGPLGVLGPSRAGRSSLLTVWAREQERPVIRIPPNAGGAPTSSELNQVVARAVRAREGQSAEGALRGSPPGAVVLVDDLGQWLERSVDGLSALKLWVRLFRRLADRHLFVVSMTPSVLEFASSVAGLDEMLLGSVTCDALEKKQLEQALMLRQRTTDFELEFESIGSWRSGKYSERVQLDKLYLRSRGNIGDAVDLWRRSVRRFTERRVVLKVEPSPEIQAVESLSARWLTALAAVAFHRGVTAAQMGRIFRIPRDEAQGLLSDLSRASLLRSERSGVFQLDPVLQPVVLGVLEKRGLFL